VQLEAVRDGVDELEEPAGRMRSSPWPWIWLFSIHGQEQDHLGRIEVQADHVENLLDAANAGH
jgi:hypothetical protein